MKSLVNNEWELMGQSWHWFRFSQSNVRNTCRPWTCQLRGLEHWSYCSGRTLQVDRWQSSVAPQAKKPSASPGEESYGAVLPKRIPFIMPQPSAGRPVCRGLLKITASESLYCSFGWLFGVGGAQGSSISSVLLT